MVSIPEQWIISFLVSRKDPRDNLKKAFKELLEAKLKLRVVSIPEQWIISFLVSRKNQRDNLKKAFKKLVTFCSRCYFSLWPDQAKQAFFRLYCLYWVSSVILEYKDMDITQNYWSLVLLSRRAYRLASLSRFTNWIKRRREICSLEPKKEKVILSLSS